MFDAVWLINLKRRPDRLAAFWKGFDACGWPFQRPTVVDAIDGLLVPKPHWYDQQPGAWGCLMTHFRLYEDALNRGYKRIFIFEDDCIFTEDAPRRMAEFFGELPDDWDQLYLGGLPRLLRLIPPVEVSPNVCKLGAVTGTWAIGLTNALMARVYRWMWDYLHNTKPLGVLCHLDRMFAEYQKTHRPVVYAPHPWIVGMDAGKSDICSRVYQRPIYFNWSWDDSQALNTQIADVMEMPTEWSILHCRTVNGEFPSEIRHGLPPDGPE